MKIEITAKVDSQIELKKDDTVIPIKGDLVYKFDMTPEEYVSVIKEVMPTIRAIYTDIVKDAMKGC